MINIRIAEPRAFTVRGRVDFEERDAFEWGIYATRNQNWTCFADAGETRFGGSVETVAVIAAPDGRVAVWYGQTRLAREASGRERRGRQDDTVSKYNAAFAALQDPGAAAYWDPVRTRGGERDVKPLALAACRVLHADVFETQPALRDKLLAEFAPLRGERPPTSWLLRASDDELLAASALLNADEPAHARRLLARKGIGT